MVSILRPASNARVSGVVTVEAVGTDDVAEGIAAFFEKRPPEWRGR